MSPLEELLRELAAEHQPVDQPVDEQPVDEQPVDEQPADRYCYDSLHRRCRTVIRRWTECPATIDGAATTATAALMMGTERYIVTACRNALNEERPDRVPDEETAPPRLSRRHSRAERVLDALQHATLTARLGDVPAIMGAIDIISGSAKRNLPFDQQIALEKSRAVKRILADVA